MSASSQLEQSTGATRRAARYVIAALAAAAVVLVLLLLAQPKPEVPAITVVSLEGESVALHELRGKVILVNFWATDCTVCLAEMPQMAATYRKFGPRGLEAIFIAMPYDRPDRVLHYARSAGLPFKVALDIRGEAARAFGGIQGTPTTFVVDKRGYIVQRILGEPDFGKLHALIERELAAG